MTRKEFDQKMEDAFNRVLAMPKETEWERYLYTEAREHLLWAEFHAETVMQMECEK